MGMGAAALGFKVHSGWTMLVALGGPTRSPKVLLRRRVELADALAVGSFQPYHLAREMDLVAGRALIERTEKTARSLARAALSGILQDLKAAGFKASACGLLMGSARPPATLERILASHPMVHAAEGILFREAVAEAALRARLELTGVLERDLLRAAAKRLRLPEKDLSERLVQFKKDVGAPWRQDEKYAALVAWLALADL
jgi:hypothetical protein